jgi:hypothetical protein
MLNFFSIQGLSMGERFDNFIIQKNFIQKAMAISLK